MAEEEVYLDPDEASAFLVGLGLPHAPSTLKKLRCTGGGPTFVKFGRFARYREDWLREYALSRVSAPMRSTSLAAVGNRRSKRAAQASH
jgi:hypothetical protein